MEKTGINVREKKEKANKYFVKWVIAGMFLGILLECLLTVRSVSAGKWNESQVLDLGNMIEEGQLELTDCTWEEESILSQNANAMMIFHGTENWGQIQLFFDEPVLGPTTAEWHNSPPEADSFDRFRQQEGYILQGTKEADITLPVKDNGNFRLTIHGNFRLGSIAVSKQTPVGSLTPGMIVSHINWFRMMVFMLLGAAGLCLYEKEGIQKKRGSKSRKPQEKRYVYLDGIRVLAAVLVVVVHEIEPLALLYPMGSKRYTFLKLLSAAALNCNLLFVMISGALLLGRREKSWGSFFKKRFLKVLLPLAVYGMFYLTGCCISRADLFSWLSYGIQTYVTGDFIKGPHLWLIYVLLGLYITVIPFQYMLREMKEPAKKALTVLILLCLLVNTLGKFTGKEPGISVFLGDWPGIFIMGYLVDQPWMRKYDPALAGGGAAALAVSAWIIMIREDSMDVIANQSILSMLMASAVFVLLLRLDHVLLPAGKILASISRYSYSIILIHWYMLIRVVHNGWFHSEMNQYLQVILPIGWCILLSMTASWVIDHFIIDVFLERVRNVK